MEHRNGGHAEVTECEDITIVHQFFHSFHIFGAPARCWFARNIKMKYRPSRRREVGYKPVVPVPDGEGSMDAGK